MRVEHRLGGWCKFGANRERAVQDVVLHAYALTKIGVASRHVLAWLVGIHHSVRCRRQYRTLDCYVVVARILLRIAN